ncbi:hypothetical protein ABK040_011948 [Willaertia magna]
MTTRGFLGGLFSGVNNATDMLSGAIDVVCIEQPDGTLKCTPWHVRFGRLKVMRSREKVIRIMVNGKLTELCMKIGEAGDSYFVHETSGPVDRDLVCSPIDLSGMENVISNSLSSSTTTTLDGSNSGILSSPASLPNLSSFNQEGNNNTSFISITNNSSFTSSSVNNNTPTKSKIISPLNSPSLMKVTSSKSLIEEDIIHEKFIPIEDELPPTPTLQVNNVNTSFPKSSNQNVSSSTMMTSVNSSSSLELTSTTNNLSDDKSITSTTTTTGSSTSSVSTATNGTMTNNSKVTATTRSSAWNWAKGITSWLGFKTNAEQDEFQGIRTKGNNEFVEQQFVEILAKHYGYDALTGRYLITDDENTEETTTLKENNNLQEEVNNSFTIQRPIESTNNIPIVNNNNDFKNSDNFISHNPTSNNNNIIGDTLVDEDESDDEEFIDDILEEDEEYHNLRSQQQELNNSDNYSFKGYYSDDDKESISNSTSSNNNEIDNDLLYLTPSLPPHMMKIKKKKNIEDTNNKSLSKSLPQKNSFEDLFKEHQLTRLKQQMKTSSRNNSPTTNESNNTSSLNNSQTTIVGTTTNANANSGSTNNTSKNPPTNENTYWRWFWSRPLSNNATNNNQDAPITTTNGIVTTTSTPTVVNNKNQVTSTNPEFKVLKKSLRPNSDELKSLSLQYGKNDVKFLVTSRILGTQEISISIYLWKYDDKIVVSDVDGTITKSDALGHILPMLGQDWSHSGIGKLYTKIVENGYRIMYLTSRSIIQSGSTKRYIFTLQQQDNAMLPEGPVIMSPDRLFAALHREVILKKPEEFKKAALDDILNLFPPGSKPFFAGFGNRVNDVISYLHVGIPDQKIFTIDPTSSILVYGISHQSYVGIHELVDEMFPAQKKKKEEKIEEDYHFHSFSYWRLPIPSVKDLEEEEKKKKKVL